MKLHGSDLMVEHVARHVGYAGVGNFYAALEKKRPRGPVGLSGFGRSTLAILLRTRLEIDLVKLVERTRNNRL